MADSVVLTALTTIYQRRGYLTPLAVVEAAASPDHELHDRFEWDDQVAGESYRLLQAGALIRSVKLRITEPEPIELRAFVHIPGDAPNKPGSYVPEGVIREDPALRAVALQTMSREWRLMKRRYDRYAEFWQTVQDDLSAAVGD